MAPRPLDPQAAEEVNSPAASLDEDLQSVDVEGFEVRARQIAPHLTPDADLESMSVIFGLMRAAARIQQDLETHVHRPAGLTWASFRLLFLVLATGPMSPQDIAHQLSVTPSSISAVLNTLQRYGLIERKRTSSDGRVVTVGLTNRGRQITSSLFVRNNRREIEWAASLTPEERATLVRLLRKILLHRPKPPAMASSRLIMGSGSTNNGTPSQTQPSPKPLASRRRGSRRMSDSDPSIAP
jgi:DNA-binding MarR family transcriptional regulator